LMHLVCPLIGVLVVAACSPPRASPSVASGESMASPADVILASEPWTFESATGQLIRTPSYRVYSTASRYSLTRRLPVFLECALIQYTTALCDLPRPKDIMETYVLANRPQWARVTQRFMGQEGEVYLKIQRGGFAARGRAILYDIGPKDTFAIAAHEGWHQYTQTTFRSPLPICFEEGVATLMEGFRWEDSDRTRPRFLPWHNTERFEQLRAAHARGRLIPLAKLVQSSPQEIIDDSGDTALVYYAQVWALMHFLREGEGGMHRSAFERLLRDAAFGELARRIRRDAGSRAASAYAQRRTGSDVFKVYFGRTPEEMEPAYLAFVAHVVRVGARESIVAGRSPVE
jgi:hypothetical protein